MSPFAQLLTEAASRLRTHYRRAVGLHFDWDGVDGSNVSWTCWHDGERPGAPTMYEGGSGEQALRRLVDALRMRDGT